MAKTPFATHYLQAANQTDDDRQILVQAAQATLNVDSADEIALTVYSCVAQRDAAWQQVISKLLTTYPTSAAARGWVEYSAFFTNPAGDAVLQEALRRLLTYGTTDYTYTTDATRTVLNDLVDGKPSHSVFQWSALADAARLQLGDTNPHVNALIQMVNDSLLQEAKRYIERQGIREEEPELRQPANDGKKLYEMLWDCRFCGTTKLLGKSQRFCPTCGAAQDPSWRYFPSEEDKVYVDEYQYVGADVVCASCGNLNTAEAVHCVRCGAPMEGGDGVRKLDSRSKIAGEGFKTEDLHARLDKEAADYARGIDPASKPKPQGTKKSGGIKRWQVGAGVSVIVGIIGVIFAFIFWTSTESVAVVDHRWEISIDVQSVQAVEERREGTCRSVAPADAYREREQREQVDTERVQVGENCTNIQRDRGDGVVEEVRECSPVYENRAVMGPVCYFTVDRWLFDHSVTETGGLGDTIVDPQPNLTRTGCNGLGCQRLGDRDEDYILIFARNDEEFSCEVDEAQWRQASRGDEYTVEVGRVGGGERCSTLERAQ